MTTPIPPQSPVDDDIAGVVAATVAAAGVTALSVELLRELVSAWVLAYGGLAVIPPPGVPLAAGVLAVLTRVRGELAPAIEAVPVEQGRRLEHALDQVRSRPQPREADSARRAQDPAWVERQTSASDQSVSPVVDKQLARLADRRREVDAKQVRLVAQRASQRALDLAAQERRQLDAQQTRDSEARRDREEQTRQRWLDTLRAGFASKAKERAAKARDLADEAKVRAGGFVVGQAAIDEGNKAVKDLERDTTTALVEEHTRTVRQAAMDAGDEWGLMWVPEDRSACVRCQAYAGYVIPAGDQFEGGLSFRAKDRDRFADAIDGPPLHPWCRCALSLSHLATIGPASAALKREARRAVVSGWALPTEANTARVDAAMGLLADGAFLPRSVTDKARRRLAKGGRFVRPEPS